MNPNFKSIRRYRVSFYVAKEVEADSAQAALDQVAAEVQKDPFGMGIEVDIKAFASADR